MGHRVERLLAASLISAVLVGCGGPGAEQTAPDAIGPEDATPDGWIEVRTGDAVLAVPPDWRQLHDDDPEWHRFYCGDRTLPTIRVSQQFFGALCPLSSPDDLVPPSAPTVHTMLLDDAAMVFFTGTFLDGSREVVANGMRAFARSTEQGVEELLIPELRLHVRAEEGSDPDLARRVMATVHAAEDAAPPQERAPLLAVRGEEVWSLTAEQDVLVATAGPEHILGSAHLAPGSTVRDLVVALGLYPVNPPKDRVDLRPSEIRVVRVVDGATEAAWKTEVAPTVGGTVDGLSVGGGPIWSPDGRYLAYGGEQNRQSVITVVGWRGGVGVGEPDVHAAVRDLILPVETEPFAHGLWRWEWDEPAEGTLDGRLLFDEGITRAGMWLPVRRLADGQIELPSGTFTLP